MEITGKQSVSVVIPTINREKHVVATIKDLLIQDYKDYEIIVVDQSEEASTEIQELSRKHSKKLHYIKSDKQGLPEARNLGWKSALNPVVLYVDDDISCGPELIKEHVDALEKTQASIIAGGIDQHNIVYQGEKVGSFSRLIGLGKRGYSHTEPSWVDHAPGGNMAIRRSTLEKTGGFDEHLSPGAALYEETDFCLRAKETGARIYFEPKARLTHFAAPAGGCRVLSKTEYVEALSRNRTAVIWRHTPSWCRPIALARLLITVISFTLRNKNPLIFLKGLKGILQGYTIGKKQVKNSYL
jgi:GT2 family glycosyltransferase